VCCGAFGQFTRECLGHQGQYMAAGCSEIGDRAGPHPVGNRPEHGGRQSACREHRAMMNGAGRVGLGLLRLTRARLH
jgi:hypothetical protein